MGALQLPNGQTVYLPDFLSGGQPATAPSAAPAPPVDPALADPPPPSGLPSFAPPPPIQQAPDIPMGASAAPAVAPAAPAGQAVPKLPADIAAATQGQLAGVQQQQQAVQQGADEQKQAADEQAAALAARDQDIAKQQAENAKAEKVRQDQIAAKQKEYDDAVNAFSRTKIDDQRRWNSMGTGQKVLTGIALALSAVGQAFAGRPGNPALELIQQSIRDDVAAQVRDREGLKEVAQSKRTSLDDYMARTKDARQAEQLKIAEEYKRTADQIETIAARHKGGEIAANALSTAGKLREDAAKIVGEAGTQAYGRQVKQQELGIQGGQLALGRAQLAQSAGQFQQAQAQALRFHNDELDMQASKLALEGRKEQAKELLAQKKELGDRGFLAPTGITKGADGSIKPGYDWLKQQDGTPYTAPEKSAEKLHEIYAGTTQAIDALDSLRKLRSENGPDINKWGADARAKILEYERALIGAHAAAGINGFRGNVMEVMDKQLSGGADPTSVLVSVMPLLDRARANLATDFNTKLKKEGNYTGDDVKFPDPLSYGKPAKTVDDAELEDLYKNPGTEIDSKRMLSETGIDVPSVGSRVDALRAAKSKLAEGGGMLPSQRQVLDSLGAQVNDPSGGARARAMLESAAKNGGTPGIRAYANKLLSATIGAP